MRITFHFLPSIRIIHIFLGVPSRSTHQDDERGREPARCIPLLVGSCRDSGSRQSAECRGCWARPDNLPTTNGPIQSLFCSHRCCCVAAGELQSCVMCVDRAVARLQCTIPYVVGSWCFWKWKVGLVLNTWILGKNKWIHIITANYMYSFHEENYM